MSDFFFQFFETFYFMSIHFRFYHYHPDNLHQILLLLVYHMIEVDHVHQQVVVILMCKGKWRSEYCWRLFGFLFLFIWLFCRLISGREKKGSKVNKSDFFFQLQRNVIIIFRYLA